MSFSAPLFRQQFREFADPAVYTDAALLFHSGVAAVLLPENRWGGLLDSGISLFVAHHLAIARPNEATSEAGGTPGKVTGPQTSKTVDKVSVSYDTSAVSLTDGAFWNLTTYGIRFLQLARMMGAGGIQL